MDQQTLWIVGGLVLAAVCVLPLVAALCGLGYWAGARQSDVSTVTREVKTIAAGLKSSIDNVNSTLKENLEHLRDDHRELRGTVEQHSIQLATLKARQP